ncbi:hypothetical protein [uncultured Agrobacterium sp.]|nr:hypothetical protein [uncultured Agrobacterium sp.]
MFVAFCWRKVSSLKSWKIDSDFWADVVRPLQARKVAVAGDVWRMSREE